MVNQPTQPENNAFQRFLQTWLVQAAPPLTDVARLAALFHSFDLPLLNGLRGAVEDTATLVGELERAGLVISEGTDRYAVQPSLRELLLRRWQDEDLAGYRHTSARTAALYIARLPGDEADQVEYVYHQLGAEDASGTAVLATEFERAWVIRHLGLAERLVRSADEQAPVFGPGARAWLRYFHARLDFAYGRYDEAESRFGNYAATGVRLSMM